jgi:antitoxin MazE
LYIQNFFYLCNEIIKVEVMTAIQLRAELFREMSPLLDNESAMTKVIAFVKGLAVAQKKETGIVPRDGWAAAAKQAHADGEDKLMVADIFEDEAMGDWKW